MTSSRPPEQPGHRGPDGGAPQQPYGQPPYAYGQSPNGQQPGYGPPLPSVSLDVKRLRPADAVVSGGTLVYLVLSLLPWVSFSRAVIGFSVNGWELGNLVPFAFFCLLLASVWAVLPAVTEVQAGFPRSYVTVGLSGLALLLTLIAWLRAFAVDFSVVGLLATLVAVAITVCAVLRLLPEIGHRGPGVPSGMPDPRGGEERPSGGW
jgi:hypothetical protein